MESRRDKGKLNYYLDYVRYDTFESAHYYCKLAVTHLTTTADISSSDCRTVSEQCHSLANKFFNVRNYDSAADVYKLGIQSLIHIEKLSDELIDSDFRNLAELFIDLSDAYMHLFNQEAAGEAFANAIKAFNYIKSKSRDELKAAAANDNYASFRLLYERRLSTTGYLRSCEFNNHEKMLHQHQEDKQTLEMFGDMALSPEVVTESKLEDMMDGLTFTPQPLFSVPTARSEPSDNEYRAMGKEYICLARNQQNQQLIRDAIKTLTQARSAYQQIQQKLESDYLTIKDIGDNILQLQIQGSQPQWQASSGRVSTTGLFGGQTQSSFLPSADTRMEHGEISPQWG